MAQTAYQIKYIHNGNTLIELVSRIALEDRCSKIKFSGRSEKYYQYQNTNRTLVITMPLHSIKPISKSKQKSNFQFQRNMYMIGKMG